MHHLAREREVLTRLFFQLSKLAGLLGLLDVEVLPGLLLLLCFVDGLQGGQREGSVDRAQSARAEQLQITQASCKHTPQAIRDHTVWQRTVW